MSRTTDIDLAGTLAAGNSPDVVLLDWAGKALPPGLQPFHRDMLAALRLVRGLTRLPGNHGQSELAQRLEAAARGGDSRGVQGDWLAVACSSPPIAAMSASLLQAARRELLLAARGEALFAGWSDFYNHARFSIVPAGRALLAQAAVGDSGAGEAMDALMTAVALTGVMQEAGARYRQAGVGTMPLQWLGDTTDRAALGARRSTLALRKAFDRGAERGEELLAIAQSPQCFATLGPYASRASLLSRRLLHRLRRRDPLAHPVSLGWFDRLALRLARHARA